VEPNRTRRLAARTAGISQVLPTDTRMRPYTHNLNTRLHTKFGRTHGSVKLIFGLQTVVADNRQE
jgi:long-chain alkane monooxygenase